MKRGATAALALALTAVLAACSPSPEQQECESAGGDWVSKFSHFIPVVVSTGKTTVIIQQPVYYSECEKG